MSISGETVVFALGVGGFILCLLTLIAVLSFFRQHRAWKEHRADTLVHPPDDWAEAVKNQGTDTPAKKAPSKPHVQPQVKPAVAEHQRLPVREATPDQVVIQIDPPPGPSRDQQNVQRLIEFLKNESKNNAKVS